jgi:6-phosphofructokinase 1
VKIDIVMGRDAGFLTAASVLARERKDDGPHLIYLPEVPFSLDGFVADVKKAVRRFGRAVIAVSEGIRDASGVPVAAMFAGGEKDSHGNLQLSGMGQLGDYLASYLKKNSDLKRVRADTFGYLQRSFPGIASETDLAEACGCARAAVRFALKGECRAGTVALVRKPCKRYCVDYVAMPIAEAAKFTRSMPKEFIARSGNDVTGRFVEYLRPIVGDIPKTAIF